MGIEIRPGYVSMELDDAIGKGTFKKLRRLKM